jgi:AcrR family transcriptional regulator
MAEQRVMVRPGGRTEANRKAVAIAVLKMVSQGNLLFDVGDVADLSGVHRTTIRRRWPDRDALLAEAMAEHTSRFTVDLSGDWPVVLRRIAFGLRDFMNDPVEDALNRVVAISTSEAFTALVHRHWQRIFAGLAPPLIEARESGRLAAHVDIEMVFTTLSAAILFNAVHARRPMDDAQVERLLAQVVRGMRP